MRRVFIDTSFLIAFLRIRDNWHHAAVRAARTLDQRGGVEYVTTHLVLAEFLAHVSRGGDAARTSAVVYVAGLMRRPDMSVVDLTPELFARGLDLYRSRPDKRYSLADCVSMVVCADLSITEVLTSDTDFESEGLDILLKD